MPAGLIGSFTAPVDYYLCVARGLYPDLGTMVKFGTNPDVGTEYETVWGGGGLYNWPAAASIMKVSSSNTNDTSAGTGARTLQLFGLDTNYLEINETITLNGQTAVNTVNSYLRVFRAYVVTAGSGATNAGDIYVFTGNSTNGVPDTATQIYIKVLAGLAQTTMACYTVPAGKTGYLLGGYLNAASSRNVNSIMFVRPFGGVFLARLVLDVNNSTFAEHYTIPVPIPARSDIDIRAKGDAGSARVNVGFTLLLIND